MDRSPKTALPNIHSQSRWIIRAVTTFACGLTTVLSVQCAEPNAWNLVAPGPSVQLQGREQKTEGNRAFTRFEVKTKLDFQNLKLLSNRPAALAIGDFQAAVRINSNQRGIQLALRMVLPHQLDPRTQRPLTTLLVGDSYNKTETWQTLKLSSKSDTIKAKVRQLRAELNEPAINTDGAYFDACVLLVETHRGNTFVDVSQTDYGPIVPPKDVVAKTHNSSRVPDERRVRIDREQLFVGPRPILLRFLPDHGEPAALMTQMGVNGVWVPDVHAESRMRELLAEDLLILATPPHPEFDPGDFSAPVQGLPPLEQSLPVPSIWYLGTNIAAEQMGHLLAWAREIRSADRNLRRPIMADVKDSTDVAARQIDFVGLSRHKVGGRLPFGKVRNLSFIRQNATAQLAFPWEWIQTEAADDLRAWRARAGVIPVHVEPEQIIMQTVACLSAGSRGIGFWKTQSLHSKQPATQELIRAIELANIYASIVEPHLVQGRIDGHIPIQTEGSKSQKGGLLSAFGGSSITPVSYAHSPSTPDGAVISGGGTSLILAGYWDSESQFVPQKLYSPNATLTVAATETASAWQITATSVRGLRRQPTAGGLYLHINDFDQLALIFVSSDPQSRREIEQRVYEHADTAARLYTEIAELKLARVRHTCALIEQVTKPDGSVEPLFRRATVASQAARSAFSRREYASAEKSARQAMRITREIQNRYWYRAIQSLPSPTASPHTLSFSTLPDHWKLMNQIAATPAGKNLVPSGSFDSLRLLSTGMWKSASPLDEQYFASADIKADGNRMALRLRAAPRTSEPERDTRKPSVLLSAPEIAAQKGDIFEITGRVRSGFGVAADVKTPFMIFDNDLGPESAVSPALEPSWRTFRLYRQASVTGPFKVWLALRGAAEVFVDDFSVVRHVSKPTNPAIPQIGKQGTSAPVPGNPGSRVQGAGYSNSVFP